VHPRPSDRCVSSHINIVSYSEKHTKPHSILPFKTQSHHLRGIQTCDPVFLLILHHTYPSRIAAMIVVQFHLEYFVGVVPRLRARKPSNHFSIPGRRKGFCCPPKYGDRPWSPLSLLSRAVSPGKSDLGVNLTTHSNLCGVWERVELYLHSVICIHCTHRDNCTS
jgi:hypothetical protein